MKNNNWSNSLIKWGVFLGDFVVLNMLTALYVDFVPKWDSWNDDKIGLFYFVGNVALLLSQYKFASVIHERLVGADVILRRTFLLALSQTLLAYILLRMVHFQAKVGWWLLAFGFLFFAVLIVVRFLERWAVKCLREAGQNTRYITLVGNDTEIVKLKEKLLGNPTYGYRVTGYYGDLDEPQRIGSVDDFIACLDEPEKLKLGDELYLCVSCKDREVIGRTIRVCDRRVVKFFYVPLSEESVRLEPVMMDDQELYAAYVTPLDDSLNKLLKRVFDIVIAVAAMMLTALIYPVVFVMMKVQSPGPLLFRQKRTGLDGRGFVCYKFRSMHVNKDADRLQATKDDPRKYPFGNFMRKSNIDELPQFWNVLRGDMSVVGPRPHMLAHTEQYSALIDKYMVRHFVKPGITGWAQVTGFRGETKELWQMEGRVERDIWYMRHWSLWLDCRIIWMTAKSIFVRDQKAY